MSVFWTNNHGQAHQITTWPDGVHQMFMITENAKWFQISASLANKKKERGGVGGWKRFLFLALNQQCKTECHSCFDPMVGWASWGWCNHHCFIKKDGLVSQGPLPRCCCAIAHWKWKLCCLVLASNLWEQPASFGCMKLSRCPLPATGGKAPAIDDELSVSQMLDGHSAVQRL